MDRAERRYEIEMLRRLVGDLQLTESILEDTEQKGYISVVRFGDGEELVLQVSSGQKEQLANRERNIIQEIKKRLAQLEGLTTF